MGIKPLGLGQGKGGGSDFSQRRAVARGIACTLQEVENRKA